MRAIFVASNTLASRAICRFDGSPASHVGISVDDGETVIDSTYRHRGVRQWPRSVYERAHGRRVVADLVIDLPDERAAREFALSQIGRPYDWTALFGMALWGDWQDPSRWYCSELAVATAVAGGLVLAIPPDRLSMRPALEILHAHSRAARRQPVRASA